MVRERTTIKGGGNDSDFRGGLVHTTDTLRSANEGASRKERGAQARGLRLGLRLWQGPAGGGRTSPLSLV